MRWFSAKILYLSEIDGDLEVGELCEVSIRILKSSDELKAREKAEYIGRSNEHSYRNADGETVAWKFLKVLEVQDLNEESLDEGTEVFSEIFHKKDFPGA